MAYVFSFLFLVFLIWFIRLAIKYNNPYKLYMCFGKKGCGKTTYLTKLSFRYLKKGWTVYTTDYIPGTIHIEPEQIGYIQFVDNSVVLADEVGIIFDNRNFKNFKPEVRNYFKYQRHFKVRMYLFSQTFDVDKKIRDLTDDMYFLINYFNVFTVVKKISKKMAVSQFDGEHGSEIGEQLYIQPFFLAPFGARDYIFIPHWVKYFNSHEIRDFNLRPAPNMVVDFPDGVYPPWQRKERLQHQVSTIKQLDLKNMLHR